MNQISVETMISKIVLINYKERLPCKIEIDVNIEDKFSSLITTGK